jgi:hypothetical protein
MSRRAGPWGNRVAVGGTRVFTLVVVKATTALDLSLRERWKDSGTSSDLAESDGRDQRHCALATCPKST